MYRLTSWEDASDFLEQVAKRTGKLSKGGEPDINTVAKMVLNDWQRGKLPFFVPPPSKDGAKPEKKDEEPTPDAVASTEAENNEDETTKTKKFEPNVIQDFSKIRVDLVYEGDDIQPLEAQPELADQEASGAEDGDGEEENDENDKSTVQDEDKTEKDPEKSIADDDDDDYLSDEEDMDDDDDASDSDEDSAAKKAKTIQLKSRTIMKSGNFIVSKLGAKKKARKLIKDHDERVNPRQKLTSRERRRIDRDHRLKKIGANFYDVVNVKNKGKKKGFLEMAKAFRGHSKK